MVFPPIPTLPPTLSVNFPATVIVLLQGTFEMGSMVRVADLGSDIKIETTPTLLLSTIPSFALKVKLSDPTWSRFGL
jgi:hypothetical protein